jgi:hypothetical protein
MILGKKQKLLVKSITMENLVKTVIFLYDE